MLTTVAKVKQYGGIEEFENDLLIERMVLSATTAIENYCGRQFLSAARVEVKDGTGTRKITLKHFPVTAVASVTIDGRVIPPRPSPTGYGYTFDDMSVRLTGYEFTEGMDNVEIVYTAGLNAIPADIDMACCEVVARRYKTLDRLGVSSKSLAGETISFSSEDFPDTVTRVLDHYASVL